MTKFGLKIMYMKYVAIFLSMLAINNLFAQENKNFHYKVIEVLASDEYEGREVGTKGQEMAAKFIADEMERIGLSYYSIDNTYYQSFEFTPRKNPHSISKDTSAKPISVKNVLGIINNNAQKTIVIGAHYDHLGHGAEGSLHAAKDGQIHNGADDNASGVAVMLGLAKKLINNEDALANNYVFIAFSGEERGLWGSKYFAEHPIMNLENVNYMFNMDMVGRYDSAKGLAINGTGTSPSWNTLIDKDEVSMKLVLSESGVGPSDHTSFYLKDIPVLHFFTGQHEDYHKPTDDIDKINFEGLKLVEDYMYKLILRSQTMEKLQFTPTKNESADVPKFTVSLGVMPDYMFTGNGMRIDGVTEGRAASKAGLEKGDIVIKLGEHEVEDMMSYMKALSKFKKGDNTQVKVRRKEDVKQFNIEF